MANAFKIMDIMCDRNMDIRISTLDNITHMQLTHKGRDTKITIGFAGDVLNGIALDRFVGGFILCDKEQWKQIKLELETRELTEKVYAEAREKV